MLPDQPAWYVIHTKPKCEHLAAAMMLSLPDVETYCPRIRFQRNTRRGKIWFLEALFPSYFFARFVPANSLRAVRYSLSVIRIVDFGDQMVDVPDAVIQMIREEMENKDVKEVRVGIHIGDTVEFSEGPMRGLKGIVNSIQDGKERVKVLMDFLGRESLVEVNPAKLLTQHTPRTVLAEKSR